MEHDAVRPLQALGKDLGLRRLASGRVGSEDQNASAPAFRHEDVAVRSDPDDARLVQAAGEHLYREALRHIRHPPFRRSTTFGHVLEIRRFGVVFSVGRRRQVGGRDVTPYAGGVRLPGAEGIGAGEHLLRLHRRQRNERQWKTLSGS